MTNHTELLNFLIKKHNLKSYLEIGVNIPENNFDLINCERKRGVDPCFYGKNVSPVLIPLTSDEFFRNDDHKFDLIFLDGLHHADQVKRDFENSLKFLNDGGFIVLHDTLPDEEKYTTIPRATKIWYGDVYQFAMTLGQYDGLAFVTLNMDCGCTVVWVDESATRKQGASKLDWETYKQKGKELLNVIEPGEFKNLRTV